MAQHGTCGGEPCTCSLHADECDEGVGVFLPGSKYGECTTQPCRKQRDLEDHDARWRAWCGEVKP